MKIPETVDTLTQCAEAVKNLRLNILISPAGDGLREQPLCSSEFQSAMAFLELATMAFKRAALAEGR